MSSVSSPYFLAYRAWHRYGPPTLPWDDLLTLHLHRGYLISTPEVFACIMPVSSHWTDAQIANIHAPPHLPRSPSSSSSSLASCVLQSCVLQSCVSKKETTPLPSPSPLDTAMVWLAAGRWEILLAARNVLAPSLQGVCFTRRNSHRLRRYSLAHLHRHGIPKNATAASLAAPSRA